MKKLLLLIFTAILVCNTSRAQTTVNDFTQYDCNGQLHNLYSELDSGYVVVMEFIMNCSSCILAGNALETIIAELDLQYPGKIRLYQFAYTTAYDCSVMTSFKDTNGFNSSVFEENGHLLASLGGFGMPTIAIAGGSNHGIIYSGIGFSIADTTQIGSSMRNYFATISSEPLPASEGFIRSYPNPAADYFKVNINLNKKSLLSLSLYDLNGKLIDQPVIDFTAVNEFEKMIDVSGLPEGNYTLKISVDGKSYFEKVNVVR